MRRSANPKTARCLALMIILFLAPLTGFILPGSSGVLASAPIITNGSFETGDYTGWTLWEGGNYHYPSYGTWGIARNGDVINSNQATYDFFDRIQVNQGSPGLPRTYITADGQYLAYQLQNGAENHRLYQDVTLPSGSIVLSWDMFYRNHSGSVDPSLQYLKVNVRDPNNDSILQTLFNTVQGTSPQSIPMSYFSYDISRFAGQRVRIDVTMNVNNFYFDAGFDNFRIEGGRTDTAISVTGSPNPSTYGQAVTFTAVVAVVSPGTGTPAGTVQFNIDGSPFGTPVALSGGSAASASIATLTAGYHTITAVYSGDANFNGSTSPAFTLTIIKATPVITWANPADIVYGTTLSGAQLNATASVPGTFAYTPAAGTILNAGPGRTLSVTFTPTDSANYNTASKSVSINVLKATPVVTWPVPAAIPYGTPLSAVHLNATANVPGSFVYNPPAGTVLNAGASQSLSVAFTPADAENYNGVTAGTWLTVKTVPLTVVANEAGRLYGSPNPALTGTITGIQNNDPITASYSTTAMQSSGVGTYPIVPALSDGGTGKLANYDVTVTNGTLTVNPAPLTVIADNKAKVYGAPLPVFTASYSGFVLGESPGVLGGSLTFTTTATTTSPVGSYPVTSSGLTSANYAIAFVSGTLNVNPAKTVIIVASSSNPSTLGQSVIFTATLSVVPPGAGSPTGTVQFAIDGSPFGGPVALSGGSATSGAISSLAVNNHTVTATYAGDHNFNGSTGSLTQKVQYRFSGFLPPIGDRNNTVGSTIPIKWQLTDASGNFITDLKAVQSLLVGPIGGTLAPPDAPGSTGLRIAGNQFHFNWQTKGLSAGDYIISLTLNDGMTYTATVNLK